MSGEDIVILNTELYLGVVNVCYKRSERNSMYRDTDSTSVTFTVHVTDLLRGFPLPILDKEEKTGRVRRRSLLGHYHS